jgi:hypothetical protein
MNLILALLIGWVLLSAFVGVLVGRCIAMARGVDRTASVTTNDEATQPALVGGGENAPVRESDRPLAALL